MLSPRGDVGRPEDVGGGVAESHGVERLEPFAAFAAPTAVLRLDRVLHGAVHYPANYGFIPQTFCADGDPLDVLVLGLEPVYPLTVIDARAIGVVRMRDEKGADDKVIAVSIHDPAFCDYRDHAQLPHYTVDEIRKFFEEYKTLEKKEVVVGEIQGPGQALDIIREAFALYGRLYREVGRP